MLQANPILPHIAWHNPTSVRVYADRVLLTGFRYQGRDYKSVGLDKPFPAASAGYNTYDYQTAREGYNAVALVSPGDEWWVAIFAVAKRTDANASLLFVPYMKVSSWSSGTNTATINVMSGRISGDFTGSDILICSENGLFSGKSMRVVSNTDTTITINPGSQALSLAANDYLLIAPGVVGSNYEYKYLRTVKFDYDVPAPGYSLRNFVYCGDKVFSYHGALPNLAGTPVYPTFTEIVFSSFGSNSTGVVGPLASGVLGTIQAFSSTSGDTSYLFLSHDSSNHIISEVGSDRTSAANDGTTAPFFAPFNREKQSLWGCVSTANTTGKITVMGWFEP